MFSILKKEYYEHRWHFVVLMFFGIAALAIMHFFRYLDTGTGAVVLFIFSGPIFCLLIGSHLIESEISRDTFPFLAHLPLSRSRLWFSKLLFGILFCAALYIGYGILSIVADLFVLDISFSKLPTISLQDGAVFFLLPAISLSIGFFLSVLPRIGQAIAWGFFSALFLTFFLANFYIYVNVGILGPMIVVACLASSYAAFYKGELMNSWKHSLWGAGTMLVMLFIMTGTWLTLLQAAESHWTLNRSDLFHRVIKVNPQGTILFASRSFGSWWDPTGNDEYFRTFRLNFESGAIKQVGRRMNWDFKASPDGRYIAVVNPLSRYGFVGQDQLFLIDSENNDREIFIDSNANPVDFLDEARLLYQRAVKNQDQIMHEFCLHEIGSGTRILFALDNSQYSRPRLLKSQNKLLVRNLLVDINTGKIEKTVPGYPEAELPNGDVLLSVKSWKGSQASSSFIILNASGSMEPQTWIPSGTEVLERLSDGTLFGYVPRGKSVQVPYGEKADIITLDFASKSWKILQTFETLPFIGSMVFDSLKKTLFIEMKDKEGRSSYWKMNVIDGFMKKIDWEMKDVRKVIGIGPERFLVQLQNTLHTLDLRTNEHRQILEIKNE